MGTEPWLAGGYQRRAAWAGRMESAPAPAGVAHKECGVFSDKVLAESTPATAIVPGTPDVGSTAQHGAAFMPRSQRAEVLQQGMACVLAWAQ